MTMESSRPLYLHTLESLCADLVAGLSVKVGDDGSTFSLPSVASRGALSWYKKNRQKWAANVQTVDVEAIVDAANAAPADGVSPTNAISSGDIQQLTLVSMKAHQFAGLHHSGTSQSKPDDFIFEFKDGVTLFEGYNGCGKTSLVNAIVWALTGDILRPQRAPESGNKDFDFEVDETSTHAAPPVIPLPDPALEEIGSAVVPVDTWVELELENQEKKRYQLRRSLKRNSRNILVEEIRGIDELGLDPISTRVGTTMPGILPYVQVGSSSALGKAVSELTGMAPLVNLATHASKAKRKIDGDLTKGKRTEIETVDEAYQRTRSDLVDLVQKHKLLIGVEEIPLPTDGEVVESRLDDLSKKLSQFKSDGLNHAKSVLGDTFDVQDEAQRVDLVDSIAPAIIAVSRIEPLPSMLRLRALTQLTEQEVAPVIALIIEVAKEASELIEIAAEPNKAARVRLYARVSAWIREHPELVHDDDSCAVCGHSILGVVDDITGLMVKDHISGAVKESDYAGKTLNTWIKHVISEIKGILPEPLALEVRRDPPDGPVALIRQAILEELFDEPAFARSLKPLKFNMAEACSSALEAFPSFEFVASQALGGERAEFQELNTLIYRIERSLAFPAWRSGAKSIMAGFMREIVGKVASGETITAPGSLLGQLFNLQAIVEAVAPIDESVIKQERLVSDIRKRRVFEQRIKDYRKASLALNDCVAIGELAEQQVKLLQQQLHSSAAYWRRMIYQSAFPSTSMELVGSRMSGSGDLQLFVGGGRVGAPAQHVSNASALRASLFGFYLAYWQHMLKERGGLRILLLDDPQELLDGDNRDRLADAIYEVAKVGAQLIMTTHDTRFAVSLAKSAQRKLFNLNHQYVHPATATRGVLFLTPSVAGLQAALSRYNAQPDDPSVAQEYLSECRVFLEGRMGDLFDDRIFPAATSVNFAPTLGDHLSRLRGLIKNASNELFKSPAIVGFVNDPALKDGSAVLALLNKVHHRDKKSIRPKEIFDIKEDLERLRHGVERAHEAFRTFNRREPLVLQNQELASLVPAEVSPFSIPVQASLKAFVRGSSFGDSQEIEHDVITSDWFNSKALFYVRSESLGFAGPKGSVAIVDIEAVPPTDRQLVIARAGKEIYARRLLKPHNSEFVALAAETPDPRRSPPTQLLQERQVTLHPILGMLFGGLVTVPTSKAEAVQVTEVPQIERVRTAYRIKEESAVPLALPGQIALGGAIIPLDELDAHVDEYVALHVDDGTNLFKRVGRRLPEPLQHLRQFESIGGLGVADVLAIGGEYKGVRTVVHAVSIIGVLYK